ncbi:MAG: putative O-glycosylation ligase, exosortase A system-associated [Planctomycetota bacterium]
MRDLIVFGLVCLSLPYCFRRPYVGLLMFTWLAYMRPQDLCWGFAQSMRFSFYVGLTMVAGFFAHEQGRRPFFRRDVRTRAMLALLILTILSLIGAKRIDDSVGSQLFEFTKIVLVAMFTTGQVDTKERIRALSWVIAVSLGLFGVKGGLHGILKGGAGITRGPGGMLEDNNDFALGMVMCLPFVFYMGSSEKSLLVRRLSNIACVLICITILLTHSRGGFLSMTTALLMIAARSGKLFRASIGLSVLVVLFFAFAPKDVTDRLGTITDVREGKQDSSVEGRLVSWAIALEMVKHHPLLGVGLKNFQANYQEFGKIVFPGIPVITRVTHNSYLQIWSENGSLAFICFLLILFSVFFISARTRRIARMRADLAWARTYANMVETSMAGFVIGGFFLNRGQFDLTYQVSALASAVYFSVRAAAYGAPETGPATDRPSGRVATAVEETPRFGRLPGPPRRDLVWSRPS